MTNNYFYTMLRIDKVKWPNCKNFKNLKPKSEIKKICNSLHDDKSPIFPVRQGSLLTNNARQHLSPQSFHTDTHIQTYTQTPYTNTCCLPAPCCERDKLLTKEPQIQHPAAQAHFVSKINTTAIAERLHVRMQETAGFSTMSSTQTQKSFDF